LTTRLSFLRLFGTQLSPYGKPQSSRSPLREVKHRWQFLSLKKASRMRISNLVGRWYCVWLENKKKVGTAAHRPLCSRNLIVVQNGI